jgi:hypothetical protein
MIINELKNNKRLKEQTCEAEFSKPFSELVAKI